MKVPQHIELAGYDKIHYINTMYPWEGHIYRRPAGTGKEKGKGMFSQAEYNPVGSYIRKFDLQDELRGKKDRILSFEWCRTGLLCMGEWRICRLCRRQLYSVGI